MLGEIHLVSITSCGGIDSWATVNDDDDDVEATALTCRFNSDGSCNGTEISPIAGCDDFSDDCSFHCSIINSKISLA